MASKENKNNIMDKLVSLCKRRGFIFQSSEIYGGIGSFWDFGPLGVEMKKNIKELWWKDIVQKRDNVVGIETSIIMHSKTWEASGHITNFHDPLVDCKECKKRFRLDHLPEENQKNKFCPECKGELTEPRNFNLMFSTFAGPVEEEAARVYLRPETAQGIFVNFDNILNCSRQKLPFGIAQIGKSFRNEISPGNFVFRSREFEQMELEFFVAPETDDKWFNYWLEERKNWYIRLGLKKENLQLRQHNKNELAHYAKDCYDIEYLFPFGWQELEGIANRTDFDLSSHIKYSGKNLSFFDETNKSNIIPYVIESSAGVERTLLTLLIDAYCEEIVEKEKRLVLKLHPRVAPIKVAILPLVKKDGLAEKAKELEISLREHFTTFYDESGSIGRRYRRQDEIGTPFCITIDYTTMEDNTVTIRFRDLMNQERINISEITNIVKKELQ